MLPVVEPEGRLTAQQIVIFTVMLIPVSLAPYFFGLSGVIYLVGAFLLGIWFLAASIKAARSKSDRDAKKLLLVSVVYLPVLFVLMVADKL
jgi:protoheme IX farnesyltransferase